MTTPTRLLTTLGFAAAAIAFAAAAGCQRNQPPASAAGKATQIERGRLLVTIGGCNDCHTPLKFDANVGMPIPDMSRMLSGHPLPILTSSGIGSLPRLWERIRVRGTKLDRPPIPIEQWRMTEAALQTMHEITSTWVEDGYPNFLIWWFKLREDDLASNELIRLGLIESVGVWRSYKMTREGLYWALQHRQQPAHAAHV